MKKTFIKTLAAGQTVDDVFLVRQKQVAFKKDGAPYLLLHLADRTGELKAVMWDNVERATPAVGGGQYVKVKGNVVHYKDALQLVVRQLEQVGPEQADSSDFLPATDRDVEQMWNALREAGRTVTNEHLSRLLEAFFQDDDFALMFKKAPAAKKMHHAYLGGLLEHTLSVVRLVQSVSGHYKGIDKDVLLAGAILHDIGKIHEFCYETHIDYTDAGRLMNHIVIGVEMLEKKLASLGDFPEMLGLLLKHMIVSHHGTRDFGSPEPPKTLEAVVLNYLDELDAKVTGIRAFMDKEDQEAPWTSYHRLLDRFFFRGPANHSPANDSKEDEKDQTAQTVE